MSSAVPERTNKAMAIKLRPNTDLLDPFTFSITPFQALKNLAWVRAEIVKEAAEYLMTHSLNLNLMTHSLNLNNYVALLIVMLVNFTLGYEYKFQLLENGSIQFIFT
jgi:hypothetical protein